MKTRKQRRSPIDVNVRFGMIAPERRPGPLSGILAVILFLGGILVWFVLFALKGDLSRQILKVEVIVNVILLAVNVFAICRIGYDGFVRNTVVTWVMNVVLAVAGFYLAGVHVLPEAAGELQWFYGFMEFLVFMLLASFMSMVPALAICLVMWLVMAIFGD